MRLDTLHLGYLGHFRDRSVPLAGPPGALRFVVGPNEAGKSTVRAGVRAALFGVSAKSVQGTPQRSVRVGVDYTTANGDTGQIHRTGAREPRGGNDQVIHPDDLAKLLGVTPELFDTLFCLGHHELREHGAALLQAEGSIGAILFGAALGGTAVHDTMRALTAHAELLHTPRGRKQRIHSLLADLKAADTALDSVLVSAERWAELTERRDALDERLSERRGRRTELAAQCRDVERLQSVGPLLAQRARLQSDLRQLAAEGPLAADVQIHTITEALDHRRDADLDRQRLAGDIARARAQLDQIPVADDTLDHSAAIEHLAESRVQLRDDLADIDRLTRTLHGTPQGTDLQVLRDVLADTATTAAGLEALAENERRAGEAHATITTEQARLGLDGLDPDQILALAVPSSDALDAARAATARRSATREQLHERAAAVRRQRDATEATLAGLRAEASIPDPDAVADARVRRDHLWLIARARLVGEVHPDDDPTTPAPELAERVTEHLAHADVLVDAVLADTDRVSELRALQADLASRGEELAGIDDELAALDGADAEAQREWRAAWQPVGRVPATVTEGLAWRTAWESLGECIAQHRRLADEIDRRHRGVVHAADSLRTALAEVGESAADQLGFAGLRARAEAVIARADERRADEERLTDAQRRVDRLFEQLEPLRALLGPDAAVRRPDEVVAGLRDRRDDQRANHRSRQALLARLDELDEQRTAAQRRRDAEQHRLDAVANALGVAADELDAVRRRSVRAEALRDQLDDNAELIVEAGGGLDLDTLTERSQHAGDDPQLAARLAGIATETATIDTEIDQLNQQVGELTGELARIDGSDAALELEARRQELLAELAVAVEDFVEVTLAAGLLEQVIADTGSGRHDHLLARANHYFQALTVGEFTGLEVESHGDEHHAVALRSDGSRLYPAELSDGTLDQLWLALRLAGIEHHLTTVGPVPVVVDDVLVHFDDHRSSAALAALGELAASTQVIVLTHHPHLVDLARACLGSDRVLVAELPSRVGHAPATVSVIGTTEAAAPAPPRPPSPPRTPSRASTATAAPTTLPGLFATAPHGGDERAELLGGLSHHQWRSRSDILARCRIAPSRWSPLIKALLADGTVEQQGVKRGAKYRRAHPFPLPEASS